ncbi:hypothetical protein HHK36_030103 [Tetracentron sinense]|uniref:Protein kinase domain-containing protein n=1 Tax=Tetracentron sinense TaxID=13715 RepID=A0A834YCJ1_TETSI|nr:hypothetical protein HHK36_030103 [Tetracentron sinense]
MREQPDTVKNLPEFQTVGERSKDFQMLLTTLGLEGRERRGRKRSARAEIFRHRIGGYPGRFLGLDTSKIGQGTYSNAYKARDLITGKIVTLKKVRFDHLEPESVKSMAREILVLRQLDHHNVVKLEGLVTSRRSCSLYLVFEYIEHNLAGLAACPGMVFTEPQFVGVKAFYLSFHD